MYIETLKKRQNGKLYTSTLIRESFRDGRKVKHRTIANISKLSGEHIRQLRLMLSGTGAFVERQSIRRENNREYGASHALLSLARELGLDKLIYSQKQQWREDVLAMIVGRILYQGSKLFLANLYTCTSIWEQCGREMGVRPDVNDLYAAMDMLLARQPKIQKELAKRHLGDGALVLYDMTNVWLEGEYSSSELAEYGRNKEKKSGYKQIAVGLMTNKEGCPVSVEVFRGNTSDQMTVEQQVQKLAQKYGVKDIILAGDRGMLTPKRIEEAKAFGFKTLTALTHPQITALMQKKVIQPELFDEKMVVEVCHENENEEKGTQEQEFIRYLLCKNLKTAKRETATRASLIEATTKALESIAAVKKKREKKDVCARAGAVFAKYKMGKFYLWDVSDQGELTWELDEEKVSRDEAIDGCYVIRADMSKAVMDKDEAVAGYRSLMGVEKAFRALKTVSLEMRPIHHKTDQRIKAHIFLCTLAYYLQWHALKRLEPIFNDDGTASARQCSFQVVIEKLKAISVSDMSIDSISIGQDISEPDGDQQKIVDLLRQKAQ